jgi:sensor histidine kinase YesM
MESYNDLMQTIALTMGSAWASGINLYATILVLSYGAYSGHIALPESMMFLADPMIIGVAAFMYFVEFIADKTPVIDSGWDSIHTFVRIPAGAFLAASAIGETSMAMEFAAALAGGAMATATHATKASARVMINASPEPFTNWGASIGEDVVVVAGLFTALNHPTIFVIALVLFVLLIIWLLPKLIKGLKAIIIRIKSFFGNNHQNIITAKDSQRQKLIELRELYEKNLITEDEYNRKKEEILNRF